MRLSPLLRRLPAVLCGLFLYQPAAAMTWTWNDGFQSASGNMISPWITARGEIDAGDPMRLIELLVANGAAEPGLIQNGPKLFLDSPGGSLAAGIELAEIIRLARMTTMVDRDSECH